MATFSHKRKGGVTLIMVMLTSMIAFIFALENYISALHEQAVAHNDYQTEQAFYASQSCIEEGFMQLKTDASAHDASIVTASTVCTYTIQRDPAAPDAGTLLAKGTKQDKERSVETAYAGAGPSVTRNSTSIMHLIDKSGSMDDDGQGCTIPSYTTSATCTAHAGVWGPQPITSAKEAAKSFVDRLDPTYDRIGAMSYNEEFTLVSALTNNFSNVKSALGTISTQDKWTNIGDAIQFSTTKLASEPANRVKVEILLTDGQANRPEPESTAPAYAISKATAAKSAGIIIFAIGLGHDVNPPTLQSIASEINGEKMYFFAPDAQGLQEIYDRIADIIIAYHISQDRWQEQ